MKKLPKQELLTNIANDTEQDYEISSTGYGLESVEHNQDEQNTIDKTGPSCGGL